LLTTVGADWIACVFVAVLCVMAYIVIKSFASLGEVQAIRTPTFPKDMSKDQLSRRRHIRDVVIVHRNFCLRVASDENRTDSARAHAEEEVRWTSWVLKTCFPGQGWD
jgi:hypothetical protein